MQKLYYFSASVFLSCILLNLIPPSYGQTFPNKDSLKDKYSSQDARAIQQKETHRGHKKQINSAVISPDKKWIVTASEDGTAKIWNIESGEVEMTLLGHRSGIFSVDISPSGQYIVTGSKDFEARIWKRQSGKTIHKLKGHSQWIWCVDYSPDGTRVASSSHDMTTKIWSARDGKLLQTLSVNDGQRRWNYSCDFSSDSKKLITGHPALAVLWDVMTGEKIQSFDVGGHENYIQAVALSPDGTRAATGGLDKTITLWNTQTGQSIHKLGNHKGFINSIQYSPDGKLILSSAIDNSALLSRTSDGKTIRAFNSPSHMTDACFSHDGEWILTACTDRVILWDAETGEPLQEFQHSPKKELVVPKLDDAKSSSQKNY